MTVNQATLIIIASGAVITAFAAALKIEFEYQRSVVFTPGRYTGAMGRWGQVTG